MRRVPGYLLSLPERTLRAGAALAGGLVNETSGLLLPLSVRRTRLYQATVERLLRLVVELAGDVQGVFPTDEISPQELLKRKAAGNVVEVASMLAVGWSPIWLLAAASDVLGGTRAYLRALVSQLQRAGVLDADEDIRSFDGLLARLETTSGTLADAIDVPPLNLDDLRASWEKLQQHDDALPDQDALASIFIALQVSALREDRTLLEVSAMVALGAVQAGIEMGNTHLFDYYRTSLQTIASEGLVFYLQRISLPYVRRAWQHFAPEASTYTVHLVRKHLLPGDASDVPPAAPTEPEEAAAPAEPELVAEGAALAAEEAAAPEAEAAPLAALRRGWQRATNKARTSAGQLGERLAWWRRPAEEAAAPEPEAKEAAEATPEAEEAAAPEPETTARFRMPEAPAEARWAMQRMSSAARTSADAYTGRLLRRHAADEPAADDEAPADDAPETNA
jgi:hypothetical protein